MGLGLCSVFQLPCFILCWVPGWTFYFLWDEDTLISFAELLLEAEDQRVSLLLGSGNLPVGLVLRLWLCLLGSRWFVCTDFFLFVAKTLWFACSVPVCLAYWDCLILMGHLSVLGRLVFSRYSRLPYLCFLEVEYLFNWITWLLFVWLLLYYPFSWFLGCFQTPQPQFHLPHVLRLDSGCFFLDECLLFW